MRASKFSEEQIVHALRQAGAGTPVVEICRKMEITETTFYRWKKKYFGLGVSELRELKLLREATRQRRYSGLPNNRLGPTRSEQRSAERRAGRLARYEHVVALRATGMRKQRIAQTVSLDWRTVDTWLAAPARPASGLPPTTPWRGRTERGAPRP